MKDGVVSIHGKEYKTVALRVSEFRAERPHWSILTELVRADAEAVIMKATVMDETGRVIGTGFSEEYRASSKINRTSALENSETSSIGRALASCGMAGTEYASADEVAGAISQQKVDELVGEETKLLAAHNEAVRENFASVAYIKEGVSNGDPLMVAEAWMELDAAVKQALWIAPSKGGVFTTSERAYLKSDEVNAARKEIISE
tara:strand:+ start:1294 stop:1905 length:612 start_codon:yes stop_codon:yes gene_type:complete